jgi:hypothetical protein
VRSSGSLALKYGIFDSHTLNECVCEQLTGGHIQMPCSERCHPLVTTVAIGHLFSLPVSCHRNAAAKVWGQLLHHILVVTATWVRTWVLGFVEHEGNKFTSAYLSRNSSLQ